MSERRNNHFDPQSGVVENLVPVKRSQRARKGQFTVDGTLQEDWPGRVDISTVQNAIQEATEGKLRKVLKP